MVCVVMGVLVSGDRKEPRREKTESILRGTVVCRSRKRLVQESRKLKAGRDRTRRYN